MFRLLFVVILSPFAVFSQYAQAQSLTVNFDVFGLNENQFETAETLDSACLSISQSGEVSAAAADLLNTCSILNSLDEEDANLAGSLDRIIPEEAFAISDTLTDGSELQVTNVNARISTLRGQQLTSYGISNLSSIQSGGNAAAGTRLKNLELFLTAQVSSGDFDGRDLQQDADLTASQFTFGADYRISDSLIVGVGLGVLQHETDFSNTEGDSQVDGTNLTLFGTYARENRAYVDVVMDIGSNSYAFSRQINLVGTNTTLALADTDSTSVSLTAGIGKNYHISGWDLGPYLRAGITSASVDGYSERSDSQESGFGSILQVGSQSVDSTTLSLGGTVARAISTSRFVLVPQFNLEMEIEANNDKDPLRASFLADPNQQIFSVDGEDRDSSYMNMGAGASAVFTGGKSAYAFYETRLAHDFITQHWFKIGARVEF